MPITEMRANLRQQFSQPRSKALLDAATFTAQAIVMRAAERLHIVLIEQSAAIFQSNDVVQLGCWSLTTATSLTQWTAK